MTQSAYLPEFAHIAGIHCSSSSIRDVLAYDGFDLSEAMVFGLGSGLGFYYVHNDDFSPTRRFNGRCANLEGKFYQNVSQPIAWVEEWDPARMLAELERGRPLLAQTNIYHLPYYRPAVHFTGHGIIITGIDLDAGTAQVADTFATELLTVDLADLQAAMSDDMPPMLRPFRWAPAPKLSTNPTTPENIWRGLSTMVDTLLHPPTEWEGMPALEQMADKLPEWADAPDFDWCARFGYQAIEKRGSGGGSFCYLTAQFMREIADLVPEATAVASAERFQQIGDLWRAFAYQLKAIFVENDPNGFKEAQQTLRKIIDLQRPLLLDLAQIIDP